jgi:hypothetical protein
MCDPVISNDASRLLLETVCSRSKGENGAERTRIGSEGSKGWRYEINHFSFNFKGLLHYYVMVRVHASALGPLAAVVPQRLLSRFATVS